MLRESLRISYESVTSMTITCANNKYSYLFLTIREIFSQDSYKSYNTPA